MSTMVQRGTFKHRSSAPGRASGIRQIVLFECLNCGEPVVANLDGLYDHVIPDEKVLPLPKRTFPTAEYEQFGPPKAIQVMREVYAAFESGSWMLIGMGLRLAVELISHDKCVEHGIATEIGLKARLRELQKKYPAVVGPVEVADGLRLFGNEVAHNAVFIADPNEVMVGIELAEQLIDLLYIKPSRLKSFVGKLPRKDDALKTPP